MAEWRSNTWTYVHIVSMKTTVYHQTDLPTSFASYYCHQDQQSQVDIAQQVLKNAYCNHCPYQNCPIIDWHVSTATFNLKLVPPEPIFLNLFPLKARYTKENQWLLRTLVEFTVAYLEKWMTACSWVRLSGPTQRLKRAFVTNCTMHVETECREWNYSTLCAAELTGPPSSFQKTEAPLHTQLVQILQVKYVPGSILFHLWEAVQIFQRESIFCGKITSGVSIYRQISLGGGEPILGGTNFGGNQFWGVHFFHDTTLNTQNSTDLHAWNLLYQLLHLAK